MVAGGRNVYVACCGPSHAAMARIAASCTARPAIRVSLEAEALPHEARTRREYHRHIGDFTLFWTGVYPEVLKTLRSVMHKDHFIDYCEQGKRSYYIASTFEDEPFKEALTLWQMHGRCEKYEDPDRKEQVEFWDVDEIETLNSYKGKVRAVRALVTKPDQDPTTWCFAIKAGIRRSGAQP